MSSRASHSRRTFCVNNPASKSATAKSFVRNQFARILVDPTTTSRDLLAANNRARRNHLTFRCQSKTSERGKANAKAKSAGECVSLTGRIGSYGIATNRFATRCGTSARYQRKNWSAEIRVRRAWFRRRRLGFGDPRQVGFAAGDCGDVTRCEQRDRRDKKRRSVLGKPATVTSRHLRGSLALEPLVEQKTKKSSRAAALDVLRLAARGVMSSGTAATFAASRNFASTRQTARLALPLITRQRPIIGSVQSSRRNFKSLRAEGVAA